MNIDYRTSIWFEGNEISFWSPRSGREVSRRSEHRRLLLHYFHCRPSLDAVSPSYKQWGQFSCWKRNKSLRCRNDGQPAAFRDLYSPCDIFRPFRIIRMKTSFRGVLKNYSQLRIFPHRASLHGHRFVSHLPSPDALVLTKRILAMRNCNVRVMALFARKNEAEHRRSTTKCNNIDWIGKRAKENNMKRFLEESLRLHDKSFASCFATSGSSTSLSGIANTPR